MTKKRVCFLSMDSLDGYVSDDELAIAPLTELGWRVETRSWRDKTVDWNEFDAVIIRTTWDYQRDPEAFVSVLEKIENSSAKLENPLDIVRWNLSKTYLKEMNERGCQIVPTIWGERYSADNFAGWIDRFGGELIVKPLVSATAEHTYRLKCYDSALENVFEGQAFMVQPFLQSIVTEGEFSLFYFGGEFSHAINKAPKAFDFRVQEEHGGLITALQPGADLLEAGGRAIGLIDRELLYARIDLVRGPDDEFALMELELIEPALYFRMDPDAAGMFARHLDRRLG